MAWVFNCIRGFIFVNWLSFYLSEGSQVQ
jgi:hypothetical protein